MEDSDAVIAFEKVAAIWAETLGVDKVLPSDNFFGLGGDSIMVTIMTMQVESAFDVVVTQDMLFDNPTLSGFMTALFPNAAADG